MARRISPRQPNRIADAPATPATCTSDRTTNPVARQQQADEQRAWARIHGHTAGGTPR
ncbi:hypothetical protein [Streptomyces sp. NPDC047097]|uniref:hypothetical protein n=1 Tax=Streptomyces sp. NPDC047097 TaxID=3155260 RepID=UPI0033F86F46